MKVLFWYRKNQTNPTDEGTVQIRITINGLRAEVGSSGLQCLPAQWDSHKQRIKGRSLTVQRKNERLELVHSKLDGLYNDLLRQNRHVTAGYFKQVWQSGTVTYTLLGLFNKYIEEAERDTDRSSGTREVYGVAKSKVETYLKHRRAVELPAEQFTVGMMEGLRTWMRIDCKHEDTYVAKIASITKQTLNWAALHELIERNPLQYLRIKKAKGKPPIFLTDAEMTQLKGHTFRTDYLRRVADFLRIQALTGLAYADLKSLSPAHIMVGIDGEQWLYKDRIKTGNTAKVPLCDEAIDLMKQYGLWELGCIEVYSNKTMNLYLKVIAAELGWDKKLTTHVGRKTFANHKLNSEGYSKDSVITMMGRTSDEGLDVYAKVDEHRILLEKKKAVN